jgi:C-terminal processing protease CtpA/Prc
MSSGLRKVFGMGGTKELPMIRVSGVGLQVSVSDQGGGAFVSKIRCCSPAAFSGEIALGDNILTVDGLPASVKGNNASTAEWLTSSLDGEEGTPVWLLVANSNFAEPWQVLAINNMQHKRSTNTSNETARWLALTRSPSIYSGCAQFL